jgi:hypothetical protein
MCGCLLVTKYHVLCHIYLIPSLSYPLQLCACIFELLCAIVSHCEVYALCHSVTHAMPKYHCHVSLVIKWWGGVKNCFQGHWRTALLLAEGKKSNFARLELSDSCMQQQQKREAAS